MNHRLLGQAMGCLWEGVKKAFEAGASADQVTTLLQIAQRDVERARRIEQFRAKSHIWFCGSIAVALLFIGCGQDFAAEGAGAGVDASLDVQLEQSPPVAEQLEQLEQHDAGAEQLEQQVDAGVDAGEVERHVDADVVNERKSDAGDAEAGPPPLICITNDGICQPAGPWPYQCCRSQPCECCNKPACGQ